MGLAKRGSRRITVGGQAYRWVVAPNDGYIVLVAELAAGSGQRLEAVFRYGDVLESSGTGAMRVVEQRRSIGPRVVRAVIEAALSAGWQPWQPGLPPFPIHDADRLAPIKG